MKNFYLLNNKKFLLTAFNRITKNFINEYIKKDPNVSIKGELTLVKEIILGKSLKDMDDSSQLLLNSFEQDFKKNNNLNYYYKILNKNEKELIHIFENYKSNIEYIPKHHSVSIDTINHNLKEQYNSISLHNIRPIVLFIELTSLFKLYQNKSFSYSDITFNIISDIENLIRHPSSKKHFIQQIFDASITYKDNLVFNNLINEKIYSDLLVPENSLDLNTFFIQTYKKIIIQNNVSQINIFNDFVEDKNFLNNSEKTKILIKDCYLHGSRESLHALFAANIACDGAAIYLPTSKKYLKSYVNEFIYHDIAQYESRQKKSKFKI